jgi:hypothetical protein
MFYFTLSNHPILADRLQSIKPSRLVMADQDYLLIALTVSMLLWRAMEMKSYLSHASFSKNLQELKII